MRKASQEFEAQKHEAKEGKMEEAEKASSIPIILSPKAWPVQSVVGSVQQESDRTNTSERARSDHESSPNPHLQRVSHRHTEILALENVRSHITSKSIL